MKPNEKEQRINDIRSINFTDSISEVASTLSIVLTLYEFDDDPQIILEAKQKLESGVVYLRQLSQQADNAANDYRVSLDNN